MSLIQTIKAAQLQARKERRADDAATLTTLVGEAEMVGKNNGNRDVTDAEVVALCKKFIKNIDEVIKVVQAGSEHEAKAQQEKSLISAFLPKQLSEDELRAAMSAIIASHKIENVKGLGVLMRELKAQHEGMYDGALAAKISKELLS